jgi:hypothetical protein
MTDLRQAAQQALEALHYSKVEAITALREALAQPEQEPTCPKCKAAVLYECVACSNNNYPPRPEQQAEQCVGKDPRCPCQDGDACHYKDCGDTKALPVPVAQRPWIELTFAEICECENDSLLKFARAIEAKLKERNT